MKIHVFTRYQQILDWWSFEGDSAPQILHEEFYQRVVLNEQEKAKLMRLWKASDEYQAFLKSLSTRMISGVQ